MAPAESLGVYNDSRGSTRSIRSLSGGSKNYRGPGSSGWGRSSGARSRIWRQKTCRQGKLTSSPASADGAWRFAGPGCRTRPKCGRGAAHASRSARRGRDVEQMMIGTYGQSGGGWSPSADLQSCLESRLRARMEGRGSPLYVLTWSHWDIGSGPLICALLASVPRRSASGSSSVQSGWPAPCAKDGSSHRNATAGRNPGSKVGNAGVTLTDAVTFAGWGTPQAQDGAKGGQAKRNNRKHHGSPVNLRDQVHLTASIGESVNGSQPGTEQSSPTGQLNPDHSRWLMGYQVEWASCADTAMRSSRSSRRSS